MNKELTKFFREMSEDDLQGFFQMVRDLRDAPTEVPNISMYQTTQAGTGWQKVDQIWLNRHSCIRVISTPDSTCIASFGYDHIEERLYIEFHGNSNIYSYVNVGALEFFRLLNTESRGKYFNEYIKPHYKTG